MPPPMHHRCSAIVQSPSIVIDDTRYRSKLYCQRTQS